MSVFKGVVVLVCLGVLFGCEGPPPTDSAVAVTDALGGVGAEGFQRAGEPRRFRFPRDHGPHPGFRNEWWYLTGNLRAQNGRRFGFQFTLFRVALTPERNESPSQWATRDVYMAHLALSDIANGRLIAAERFARGAVGLAGAEAEPFRVWLEDWSLAQAGTQRYPWRLTAATQAFGLDLDLEPTKGVVLQGDSGLSRKGAAPGAASYYYSLPRLQADGRVRLDGKEYRVEGLAWLDREWSTSALDPEQVGWDWFSLHLDDGSDLMFYHLRRRDGGTDPHSAGVLVGAGGRVEHIDADGVRLRPRRYWRSPDGGRYPVAWTLAIPDRGLELAIDSAFPDQELDLTVRYWEGAVTVEGTRGDAPLHGRGYAELTGYAESGARRIP